MDSPTATHRARERLIADRTNKLSEYFVTSNGNWLGQVLRSMCGVVHANFDPRNSIQKRRGVVQEYLDFVAAPDFGPIAERDPAFKAVLAFAEIFGAFVDEMNERTVEGQSMEARGNRASSSPADVGDMSPSLGLFRSSSGRFASRSSFGAVHAVGRRAAVDNDGGSQPGALLKRARGYKVVAVSPATVSHLTPSNHQLLAQQRPPRRRSSNEANFDHTATAVVACAVCGAKVKEGSAMRRHMKGHPAAEEGAAGGEGGGAGATAVGAMDAEPASLLDAIETSSSSEEAGAAAAAAEDTVASLQPAVTLPMEQNVVLNEFGLEEESADEEEMEVEEGGEAPNDLDGWAADLYNKRAACFLCNKVCADYKSISTHLYGSHKGFSRNHFAFQCLGCSHKFRSFFGALGHIQAAFRNKEVGCRNKVTFVTAAMGADATTPTL